MCTTLSCVKRTARKAHYCIWCGEQIDKGDRYLDQRVVMDGTVDTNHWHLECDADALEAHRYEGFGCFHFSPYDAPRPVVHDYVI